LTSVGDNKLNDFPENQVTKYAEFPNFMLNLLISWQLGDWVGVLKLGSVMGCKNISVTGAPMGLECQANLLSLRA